MHILQRDWDKGLGKKLEGKLHIYVGDMDNYYLNNAVYLAEEFLRVDEGSVSTTARCEYGDRAEHCWNGDHTRPNALSRLRYHQMFIPKAVERMLKTAPAGADLQKLALLTAGHGPTSSSASSSLVYLGMILGEFPGLALDRTGIALLGAIALIATERLSLDERLGRDRRADHRAAPRADGDLGAVPAGRLLHRASPARLGAASTRPRACWRWSSLTAGGLSAVLANDIVCLAMAPVLVELCARRGLDPRAVPARAGLRGERRVGRHPDRQPAEHADRRSARPVVRRDTCGTAVCRR